MDRRNAFGLVGLAVALAAAGILAWALLGGGIPSGEDDAPAAPGRGGARDAQPEGETPAAPAPVPTAPLSSMEPLPLAWWRFEPRADGRYYARIEDASGHGHDGLLSGLVATEPGVHGNAARFPGDGAGMWMPNGSRGMQAAGDWGFAAWVRPDDDGTHVLLDKGAPGEGGTRAYGVLLDGGRLRYRHAGTEGAVDALAAGTRVPAGAWTHVALVRDAAARTVGFYVDGALVETMAYASAPPGNETGNAWIGHAPARDAESYRGAMDEPAVWARALAAEDVARLAAMPSG
jgi:hypothetical protein